MNVSISTAIAARTWVAARGLFLTSYPESLRGLLLRHRPWTALIQRDLAARVGVSMRSVQDSEAAVSYPSAQRLQAILEAHRLTRGRELEEVRGAAAAERERPRMHSPFDHWFAQLLGARSAPRSAPAQRWEISAVLPRSCPAVESAVTNTL